LRRPYNRAMRKQLRRYIPDAEAVRGNRWLRPFQNTLLHPRLWHLNRHSAAGGVAVGLFCGLIPGPLQMLGAAIVATVLRVNLPLALLCTLYTNPLTIVPLYLFAFGYGEFVLGLVDGGTGGRFVSPPEWGHQSLTVWVPQLVDWMGGLGKPLFVGLVLLGSTLAALGYFSVRAVWRYRLVRAWERRKRRRRQNVNDAL